MSAFLGRPSAGDSPFAIGDRALRDTSSPVPPAQRNPHPRGYNPNTAPAGTVNSQGVMMTPSPYGSGSVSDEARRRYEERYAKKRAEEGRKAQEEGQAQPQGGQQQQQIAQQAGQPGQQGQQGGYQRPLSQHGHPQQHQQHQHPQQWGQPPRQGPSPQPSQQYHQQPPPSQGQGQGYGRPQPGGPQQQQQQPYGNLSPVPGRGSFDAQQQQQQYRGSYAQHSPQPLHQQSQQMNFADPHPQGQGQHGYGPGQHYAENGSQPGSANSSGFRPPHPPQPKSAQGHGHGGQYTTSPPTHHVPSPPLQQQQAYHPQQQQQQYQQGQGTHGSRPGSLQAGPGPGAGYGSAAGSGGGVGPQWSNNAVPPPSQEWDRGSAHRGSFGSQTQGQGQPHNQAQAQGQGQGQGQYQQQQQQQQQAVQPGGMGGEDELRHMFDQFDLTRSGQLSSYDLQRLLAKDSLMEDPREDAVKMLMNIFDTDRSGSINFMEFEGLYRYIQDWHGIFLRFDRDRSGTIDRKELHQALLGFGFSLPGDMVRKLEKRFAPPPKQGGNKGARGISFDRFLMACVTVKHFTESFRRFDTAGDGRITVNYDQFALEIRAYRTISPPWHAYQKQS